MRLTHDVAVMPEERNAASSADEGAALRNKIQADMVEL
jgi:hypothetical protein